MWEFIRDSALLWIGLFLLSGLVGLLVYHTFWGLVGVLVLLAMARAIYRISQPPTPDELEELRRRNQGKSIE